MERSKAFLQKAGNEWFDDFVFASKEPLIRRGFEIVGINTDTLEEDLQKHTIDKNRDIFIGSVEAASIFFEKAGKLTPEYIGFPRSCKPFLKRKMEKKQIKDINDNDFPFFIKPAKGIKYFTGHVIDSKASFNNFKLLDQPPNEMEVLLSEVLDIRSEYRCFVDQDKNDKLRGIHYYQGDVRRFPDPDIIDDMIEKISDDLPVAYTLDVGVTKEGETVLVEINDMWAVGNYSFDPEEYVRMTIKRTREILGSKFFGYLK